MGLGVLTPRQRTDQMRKNTRSMLQGRCFRDHVTDLAWTKPSWLWRLHLVAYKQGACVQSQVRLSTNTQLHSCTPSAAHSVVAKAVPTTSSRSKSFRAAQFPLVVVRRCVPEFNQPNADPEPTGLVRDGADDCDLASLTLGLRSGSSGRGGSGPFIKGFDADADRDTFVELLLGRRTFIVRVGAGREYEDIDFASEGPADDAERHELPHTPAPGFDAGVDECSLPVADFESIAGRSALVRGVASIATLDFDSV